ncbi:MAG: type II secretion system F family protein [Nanoarchaeota archaeon]|nr:type II secretion system F family protein [Nanoarchaeota archaeon]
MNGNDAGMLEEWVRVLDKSVSLNDSVSKMASNPDYCSKFVDLDKRLKSIFQEAMLENKDLFEEHTFLLARVGEYAGRYMEEEAAAGKLTDVLKDILKKAKNISEIKKKFRRADLNKIDEIAACYSLGQLVGCGVPILDTLKYTADNFKELNLPDPANAIMEVHNSIRQGDALANPMSRGFFSKESVYLTAIGEEIGDVDKTFKKSAEILEAKITHNPSPEQIGEILFYYGAGMFFDAGFPCLKSIRLLAENSKIFSIGPKHEILDRVGDYIEGGDALDHLEGGDTLTEALAKEDYFSKEFTERLSSHKDNSDAEFLKYSDELFEKYCSQKFLK